PSQVFIERFVLAEPPPGATGIDASSTELLVIKLGQQETTVRYEAGDTILDTARRAGLSPPFSCEQGSCATCMAHLDEGSATMRVNNALSADEVDDGWVLTCQSLPSGPKVVVDYDA